MILAFNTFLADVPIPVNEFITNRKMAKYYNRETQAAMVTVGMLLNDIHLSPTTPVFYATGIIEYEEYDLHKIATNSVDESGLFSNQLFIEKGMAQVSPLTQFKILYNMTLCFISIEYGLKGDNAAIFSSAYGLITNALYSTNQEQVLIGAGKVYEDGSIDSGFALMSKSELEALPHFDSMTEGIELFKYLKTIQS